VVACPTVNAIDLWLVGRNAMLHQLKQGTSAFTCVAFSPDGKFLAAGREDNKICLWNWQTGE